MLGKPGAAPEHAKRISVGSLNRLDLRDVTFTAPSVALYTWADDRRERLFQIVEQRVFES